MKKQFVLVVAAAQALMLTIGVPASAQWAQGPWQNMQGGVPGAQYNPQMQQQGSGQQMLQQCAYPQGTTSVEKEEEDPTVTAARDTLKDTDLKYKKARVDLLSAQLDYNRKKTELATAAPDAGDAETLIQDYQGCVSLNANSLKEFHADATEIPADSNQRWCTQFQGATGMSDDSRRALCYRATTDTRNQHLTPAPVVTGGETVKVNAFCLSKGEMSGNGGKDKGEYCGLTAKPTTHDPYSQKCTTALEAANSAYDKFKDAQAKVDSLKEELLAKNQAVKDAIKFAKESKKLEDAIKKAEGDDDDDADSVAVRNCPTGTCGKQHKGSANKAALITGIGVAGGLAALSMWSNYSLKRQITNLGYVTSPVYSNASIIGNGVSAGLPFAMAGQYGATPGGQGPGGFGCAPTVYGSPMGFPQGQFANGPYNGSYFPNGGAYTPGYGPGGGNGGWGNNQWNGGGYNQYGNYLQNQYQDQLRQNQVALYAMGYGLNAANQQYSYASQLLNGGFGGGQSGFGGGQNFLGNNFGSQFGQFGAQGSQFGNQFGGSQFGGSQFGGQCGSPFGSSNGISICGSANLGGGYAPTFSNGGYSGFNNNTYNNGYLSNFNNGATNNGFSNGGVTFNTGGNGR